MTRSTNMEHVEVLRNLIEVCRAAIKAGDWKVDGACDPDAVLRRADSAIAALSAPQSGDWVLVPREPTPEMANWFRADEGSATFFTHTTIQCADFGSRYSAMLAAAPQPPAEAQPVAWEWEYIGVDQYPRGHKVARSLREMNPTNPPYPETWRPTRPLIYGDTAPPSVPVGVEAVERELHRVYMGHADNRLTTTLLRDMAEAVVALAQQPAAVDEAMVERAMDAAMEIKHNKETWFPMTRRRMKRALTAALAGQQGDDYNE